MKEIRVVSTADLLHRVATVAALGLLVIAALHDIGFRTLPNAVSVALAGCGLAAHLLTNDLGLAVLAAGTVFLLALLAWWFGVLGGGDVKLLGATALMVPLAEVPALLIGTAMVGGLLALAFLALRPFVPVAPGPRPAVLFARIVRAEAWRIRRCGPLPYAVAIATAGAASLLGG